MKSELSPMTEPTVVGIGASAGGLVALKSFFEHMPQDSGFAFVVVVHLSPDHESHLAELLQASARFPVEQVTQNTKLERNHVYIIPPNANLNAIDTHLRLTSLEEQRNERAPIDHFFRTLADTHDWRAIAVVLTGTGTDGTLGARDIKAHGGVVIAQDPAEAEFEGMPQSVIASGVVDFVLPVAEIPASILRFDGIKPRLPNIDEDRHMDRGLLQQVFAQLRLRTDRDFSRYKRTTVFRRIARRMQLNYVEDFSRYVESLRERPEEARALADDLLINVTHFFRDPEVFARLEKAAIPRLFDEHEGREDIRVWSVGCATGEEAYSLAILLLEEAQRRQSPVRIHIFASDLHTRSLEKAREGYYPGDIATDVAPERLRKFFQQENGGYRIRKEIRDLVVFAPHNLLADPPFSRLDFVSCRNLLIYLERDVQQDIIELFHYALNPDGTLLLGPAETAEATDLFRVEDKRLSLYRKRNVAPKEPRLPVFPFTKTRLSKGGPHPRAEAISQAAHGALHQRLVEKYAPPSVLIGPRDEMLHLSEHVGRYLISPGGEPTHNAVRMVREELRMELQAGLHQARQTKGPFDSKPVPVRFNGHSAPVVLHLRPSLEPDEDGSVLVIFEERQMTPAGLPPGTDQEPEPAAFDQLQDELVRTRQQLQAMIDQYETNRVEMKSSSEEMQSTNEELRSTMEELETSKEELQSINEELQTLNQQNRHKVEELSQLSSDLNNLLSATDIATLFLDRDLRILRFTPKLSELFNIRNSDRGRPISDLTHRLSYPDSIADARNVLSRLVPVERELQNDAGRWFLTRVHPYRSTHERIEGVVVTFIDITDRKDAEEIRLTLQQQEQAAASHKAIREKEGELARVSRTLMVGELATSIAHEVNQPLAGVVTNAEAGLRWLNTDKPNLEEVKESLTLIVRDGNRASSVIKRVREFVKNETPQMALLDLREVVRETMMLLQLDLDKRQVKVKLDLAGQLPLVRGEEIQLQQVMLNLIVNAAEAMETNAAGERELKVGIAQTRDDNVEVSVQDCGIGLDPEQLDQAFDAFFSTKPAGIGMGLSISRSIIEAHGGLISLRRNADAGVTVLFRLPADQGSAT